MKHAESFGLFSSVKALRELLQTKLATGEAEAAREELQTSLEEIDVLWEELRAQAEDLARERQRYAEFFEYAPDAYLKSDGAGSAIVQDPGEAMHPSMPLNALQNVEVDYKARLSEIGKLLGKLRPREAPHAPDLPMEEKRKLEAEVRIAEQDSGMMHDILGKGELSPFTCPECHGVLARMHEGRILRFRCHTGHAFSADTLLASLTEQVEQRLWDAVRAIDETVMLLNHMCEHLVDAGQREAAERYRTKAKEALERSRPIREIAQSAEQFSADALRKTE